MIVAMKMSVKMLNVSTFAIFLLLVSTAAIKTSPKIIQGEDAKEGQFPFMVSLKYKKNDLHHCGGSILTNKWVMTAGHCCHQRPTDPDASVQYTFTGSIFLNGTGQTHDIIEFIFHDGWAPDVFEDDLCLIKIEGEFQFNEYVQPIILPVQDWPINDGELANVTGWGRTKSWDDTPTNTLQVGYDFKVLSNEHCHNLTNEIMYEGYLCAQGRYKNQSICFGDSGSPLTMNGVQIGIVSFLKTTICEESVAEFYTRVPKYVNWIKEKLGPDAAQLKFTN